MPYFHFPRPFFPNNYQYYPKYTQINNTTPKKDLPITTIIEKEAEKNNSKESKDYFFELFGLK